MTVLPGSLDYLYYNGILDHIPYEAYEMSPVANNAMNSMNAMNATQYLNMAKTGNLYNNYVGDTFVRRNNNQIENNYSIKEHAFGIGNGYGKDADYELMANGMEGKNFRQAITDAAESTTNKVSNSSTWVKGLLSAGAIGLTLLCILKGKKKPVVASPKPSFWSKLNPFNWFKK